MPARHSEEYERGKSNNFVQFATLPFVVGTCKEGMRGQRIAGTWMETETGKETKHFSERNGNAQPVGRAQSHPASKRMFSCTKNHPRQNMVPKWGIFCTISCSVAQFGIKKSIFMHQKSSQAELGAKLGHFLHHFLWRSTVRRQKECFSAPEIIPGRTWCQNGAFSAPFLVAQHSSASKRVFFCTGNHPRQNLVPKWGIFCTISCGAAQFGVKKSVFLHQKSSQAEIGAKMGHFLHRKSLLGRSWCAKWAFSAPKSAKNRQ